MKRIIKILLIFCLASCSTIVPADNFTIKLIELKGLNFNKIREVPTNTAYKDLNGEFKEIVFSTKLNFAELVLNGYVVGGDYNYGDEIDSCIIFDETPVVNGRHISLRDLSLESRHSRDDYLKRIKDKESFVYSCVIDVSKIKSEKIEFHVELESFATYTKYISNAVEVNLPK